MFGERRTAPLTIAVEQSTKSPVFLSAREARTCLFALKRFWIDRLKHACRDQFQIELLGAPDDLKTLEAAYFRLRQAKQLARAGWTAPDFEHAVEMYVYDLVVKHKGFRWVVSESDHVPHHYDLAVRRGLGTICVSLEPDKKPSLPARAAKGHRGVWMRRYNWFRD